MHSSSLKNIAISSIIVFLAFLSCPLSTHTSPVKPRPNFANNSFAEVPIDSLVVQTNSGTTIELVKIPTFARQLDGHRVRMHGMMYPPYQLKGLKYFHFIPQTKRRPISAKSEKLPLHALIPVTVAKNHSEENQLRPITIEGIFEVEIYSEDGKVFSVYHIRNAKIVDKNVRLRFKPAIFVFGC